jgi:hypothetical protein
VEGGDGMNRAQTVTQIRSRFDKNDRMNCRDILDLIETVDRASELFEKIRRESCMSGLDRGNSLVEALALDGLRDMK